MRLLKTSTLLLCVGLSACSHFQSQGGAAPEQTASAAHWWWPFGKADEAAANAPAATPAAQPVAAKVAAAEQPAGGHWWWPFGASNAAASAAAAPAQAAEQAPMPNVPVTKEWLDRYEKALRSAVAGSKFSVERRDNALALIAPADTSFNAKRHELLLPNTLGPLSKVAKLVQDDPQSGVVVLGHSDSSGNKADNDKLSLQRAQAVAAIFHLSGLGNDRLRFKGVGGDQPRADNKTAKGRALNRRVEVLLTSRGNLLALAQSK